MVANRRGGHSIFTLSVHLVWVTKYRYHVLKGEDQKRCRDILRQVCDANDIRIFGYPRKFGQNRYLGALQIIIIEVFI